MVFVPSALLVILCGLVAYYHLYLQPERRLTKTSTLLASTPQSNLRSQSTKTVNLAGKYSIEVPIDFSVAEVPGNITDVPNYTFQDSNSDQFSVALLPYVSAKSQIAGKCAVSTTYDTGVISAPVFCEGLILTNWFTISGGLVVKFDTRVADLTTQCTMNSPCPVKVPPDSRYAVDYVFLIPDKETQTLVEFFAGDAARIPSGQAQGFKGVAVLLHDSIIPSLETFRK